ncbi:MAG: hypothetical protein ABSE53_16340 [Terracidiphilus sp.]
MEGCAGDASRCVRAPRQESARSTWKGTRGDEADAQRGRAGGDGPG